MGTRTHSASASPLIAPQPLLSLPLTSRGKGVSHIVGAAADGVPHTKNLGRVWGRRVAALRRRARQEREALRDANTRTPVSATSLATHHTETKDLRVEVSGHGDVMGGVRTDARTVCAWTVNEERSERSDPAADSPPRVTGRPGGGLPESRATGSYTRRLM